MLFLPKVLLQKLGGRCGIQGTLQNRPGLAAEAGCFHGVENISAVRMKSMPNTHSEEITTVRVVA
jgi:hypothetical protein